MNYTGSAYKLNESNDSCEVSCDASFMSINGVSIYDAAIFLHGWVPISN